MKNQLLNLSSIVSVLLMSTLLVMTAACQSNKSNTQNKTGTTSAVAPKVDVHTTVVTNDIDAIKQHIATGSDINEKDPFGGSSPLISAALFDKKEIVDILLAAKADINVQNNEGSTALITAAFFCRPEIVKALLEKGADKTIKNKYGSTAFDSVAGSFEDVKPAYEMMGQMLAPMGLKLDFSYLEKTRPEIAQLLK